MYISIESCLGFQDNRYSKNERNKVHKQLSIALLFAKKVA